MKQTEMFLKRSVFTCRTSGEVMDDLFALHFPDIETVLDTTYGKGVFWRRWGREIPFKVHVTDIDQGKVNGANVDALTNPALFVLPALDVRDLRMADGIYDVGVFDPPFLAAYTNNDPGVDLSEKYGTLATQMEVLQLYRDGIRELAPVCKKGMIVKLKNGISNHVLWPIQWAVTWYGTQATGRFPEEIVVYVPKCNVLVGNWQKQEHLRRIDSTFLVWKCGKGVRWGSIPE